MQVVFLVTHAACIAIGLATPESASTRANPTQEAAAEPAGSSSTRDDAEPTNSAQTRPLRRYLTRNVQHSARHLDHGVLGVAIAGGYPHLYRVELSLGLLDHLTVGATAHWLASQSLPQWSPKVAIAFVRLRRFELGAHYFQTLYPPPKEDDVARTPSFQERDHWLLSTVSFSNAWISGGFDFGVVRGIEKDPSQDPPDVFTNPSVTRWRLGGGLHLRAGTRRWGFTVNTLAPRLMAEIAFDLRFGLFEMRKRGGWKPEGIVYSTDRRVPRWR